MMKSDFNKRAPLTSLADGNSGVVTGFAVRLPAARRQRFEDLGLVAGTRVTRVQAAPLGDPIVFEARGCRLCLRAEEAAAILIDPELLT